MASDNGISYPRSQAYRLYQTPTLDRLRLLSIVKRTDELPRSEIACETKLSVPPILRAAMRMTPICP